MNADDARKSLEADGICWKCCDLWLVFASTGCSCCSDENFTAGPFLSEPAAQQQAQGYHDQKRLASQYAKNGRYHVKACDMEELPDGRFLDCDEVWGPEVTERSR